MRQVQNHRTTAPASVQATGSMGADGRRGTAMAFAGGQPPTVEVQALVRLCEHGQRGGVTASGVPPTRVRQILQTVLALPPFAPIPPRYIRLDVRRGDEGRWRHQYGLALALAIASALGRRPIPSTHLFLGDVDLLGNVAEVPSRMVDFLNDAIDQYAIPTPLVVVLAPDGAPWVRSSSLVKVLPVNTLARVVEAVWPGMELRPW